MEILEDSSNVKKAIMYATKMHDGQLRRDGTPYINHPLNVAKRVLTFKTSHNIETLVVSAILHDVIEDTEGTYYDIVNLFGIEVASLVSELTNNEDFKKALGKEKYLELKMKNMTSWALVIKLCDRLDNVDDLKNTNESFQKKYCLETINILEFLLKNRYLSNTHLSIIEEILKELKPLEVLSNSELWLIKELEKIVEEKKNISEEANIIKSLRTN